MATRVTSRSARFEVVRSHRLLRRRMPGTGTCRRLQVAFHRSINPAHQLTVLTVDNSGEGDPVSSVRQLLNAPAKISGRTGIAELAAQLSGCFCIIDREPADRDG